MLHWIGPDLTRDAKLKIGVMHEKWGDKEGSICGECDYLVTLPGGRQDFFKCLKFGVTRKSSSDWRKKWPACGLFSLKS
jgi:hypothetical protein